MSRRPVTLLGTGRLATSARPAEVRCEVGVLQRESGDVVYLRIGKETVMLSPERAEELAVDLRTYAIEVRNGGAVA